MKKMFLAVMALMALTAQNAFAVNLTFQFDINSSGTTLYPCNAGIRHLEPAKICYDRVSGNSCTPSCAQGNTTGCTGTTTPQSCVCTGEGTGNYGSWKLDFLNAKTADWVDNSSPATGFTTHILDAPNSSSAFNQLFANDGLSFGKQITELTMNLGSEVYGTEYFVDMCFRGPQIDYTNAPSLNFGVKGKVTVTNLRSSETGAPNYQDVAKLNSKAEIKCFMTDSFNNCKKDAIPGVTTGCEEGENSSDYYNYNKNSGNFTPMYTSAQETSLLSDASMNSGAGKRTPRFCVIRYTFKESVPAVRKWKLQQARACTFTEISEPDAEMPELF